MAAMSDVLLMVGRLNYVWTNTESLMIYLIVHLLKVEKEAAIVVFLTLNTTRARMDLVERLAKLPSTSPADRKTILAIIASLKKEAKTRNKYNHCIYSFDEKGEISSTQLMRLVEDDSQVRYGKVEQMDEKEIEQLEKSIAGIVEISKVMWAFIHASPHVSADYL
ncbi:hypothetical protein [Agrobacterium tumefaciens]|uniref:hypothetical protein n=1 Tax=Agrobacterium tumefaciens TaxID=358 RepID=UPI00287DBF01|nr:hypothetical protein [Agrobacterium tumefaciens]MDS7595551.1 hypothetical protein [Agrobacterium tumefaciens]